MKGETKYKIFLILVFIAFWIWAAINPLARHGWLLENYLVFIFIPIIILSGIYFRLSNVSYTLITIFMILHVIGSHYTYEAVPFGYLLQAWFHSNRNMYDRLVHFSFGFLLAYPIREVFMRVSKSRGFWSYYLPLDLTLAFSAIYEMIEWIMAIRLDPIAGLAFLGSQGDIWDAQKDMLSAGIGALISMSIIFFINLSLKKDFWQDIKESFHIDKRILGEVELKRMLRHK